MFAAFRDRSGFLKTLIVRARPGKPQQGVLQAGPVRLACALGRGGISARKREGDGATPLAAMAVLGGYASGRQFRSGLALRRTRTDDGWCDAPGDRNYNRPVRLPYSGSTEAMKRPDGLYDACLVLGWNIAPRRRACGSAIFLHLARPGYAPTEGCIALSRAGMAWLLPRIRRGTVIKVVR